MVRLLLSNGADPNVKTHKDQTALDLARDKHPEIVSLLEPVTSTGSDDTNQAKPEPALPIVPRYLKEPDLEKSWLLPDEFSEARIENVVRQHQARKDMEQPPQPQQQQQQQQSNTSAAEKEILVYLGNRNDESIMGSVFLKNESIDASLASIKQVRVCISLARWIWCTYHCMYQELDGLPENFVLGRNNGKMTIPINSKQMDKPLLDIFRGEDDVLVIIPK